MPVKEENASSQTLSRAIEDYLKAIYTLAGDQKAASTSAIAKRLKVSSAAVTAMLKRMSEAGLVRYQRRRGVMLTKVGTVLALETIRRHRLLESFFTDHLAMDWHQAHVEAETLEHFISRELEKLIDSKLGHPLSDPHGHPIPSAKGVVSKEALKPLTDLTAGTSAVVRRVSDEDAEHMRWWKKIGLVPGSPIRVREVGPFEGPLLIEIKGKSHHVGRKAVEGIWVASDGKRKKAVKPPKAAAKAGKR
jgi:DtxR family Mn-dependent transcriptional regulator